ncbi:hypothetical protein KDW_38540 [Dictyobacter vulcani]|uniref:Lanthionine synthetase n=1 Tax=Dictyobacter vulcani TaxID=2607529 RepID=A0A5J4KRG0_9CHLR|nr:lanthionine synthetase C family protein [Dictyobacter vulcani]GER89692.1 hypothetical protein KDW_38540 [Dictyobacter vulcani]
MKESHIDSIPFKAWHSRIDKSTQTLILEIVDKIANYLNDPSNVEMSAKIAAKQSDFYQWNPPSLASGLGGIVLLFVYLYRTTEEEKWLVAARRFMSLAAQGTHQYPLATPSAFGGSAGFASILDQISRDENRYSHTLETFNAKVAMQVIEREWVRPQHGVADSDYDAINGAAGILGYLINIPSPTSIVQDAIQKLLAYLIYLADQDDEIHRRWFISPDLFPPVDRYHKEYPQGYFNCGLAHGITGPLASLSLAWREGYRISGQREAIFSVGQWLINRQAKDDYGIGWPAGIPLEMELDQFQNCSLRITRDGWCYGTPGVSRALWLAGNAIDDKSFRDIAIQGIESVLHRPITNRNIDSPTICHGISGLLMICLRFSHEVENSLVEEHISKLVHQILNLFQPDLPLGFRDEEKPNVFVDDPGLLTGTTGVLLALLAAATQIEPKWDRTFLIA